VGLKWGQLASVRGLCRGLHSRAVAPLWLRARTCHCVHRVYSSKCSSGCTGCSLRSRGAWRYVCLSGEVWWSSGGPNWALGNYRFGPPYLHTQSEARDGTHTSGERIHLATCCTPSVGRLMPRWWRYVPRNQSTRAQPVGAKTPLLDTNIHMPRSFMESPGTTCEHILAHMGVCG